MTSFDFVLLGILGLSIVLSMMRGMVKEVLSILGWIAAVYIAKTYTYQILPLLPAGIPSEALRILAAFLTLFLATLLLATLLSITLSTMFKRLGLGWLNRVLGAVFGFLRGLLIICLIVFLAGLTSIPKDVRWRNAMFSAPLEAIVQAMLPYVPVYIAQHVKYD